MEGARRRRPALLRGEDALLPAFLPPCGGAEMARVACTQRWHQPIAIDMRLKVGNTLFGLFTTFDERFSAYSPRSLLLRHTIEEAHRRPEISCLDGMSAKDWTSHWRMDGYEYYRVVTAPRSLPLLSDKAEVVARAAACKLLPRVVLDSLRRHRVRARSDAPAAKPRRQSVPAEGGDRGDGAI